MSLPFPLPREDLWAYLAKTQRPIFLYGMGDGADKILNVLLSRGISIQGIFASDAFVRGHSFRGFPVRRYRDVLEENPNMTALLCFAVDYEPMLSRLNQISRQCDFYAPDVPVVQTDGSVFDLSYVRRHEQELAAAYHLLADEQSMAVFQAVLQYKLTGKIEYLRGCETLHQEAWTLLDVSQKKHYVDLGAYNGDTVGAFILETDGHYSRITAVEPDPKNCEKLQKKAREHKWEKIDIVNAAAWDRQETLFVKKGKRGRGSALLLEGTLPVAGNALDRIAQDIPVDFIKFDVEGSESRAIAGAKETILRCHPDMEIAAYHKNEDLFAIPEQVLSICPDYTVFLRHHPYVPAWETNYYFKVK